MYSRRLQVRHLASGLLAALLIAAGPLYAFVLHTDAAEFATRQLQVSDNQVGVGTNYKLSFSGQSAGSIQSIRLQLCTNDPFPGTPCTPPAGLNFLSGVLSAQSGMTGFTVHPSSTANELILTRATPIATIAGLASYTLSGAVNPSAAGTYYGRLETFASADATGPSHDAAGLAVAYMDNLVSVSTEVPPYLLFCTGNTIVAYDCNTATGSYVDFGEFSSTKTSTGQTQFIVATNADFGYTIRALGTTLTSGTNVIPALAAPDISRKGVSQFGLNLRANSTPPTGADVQGTGTGVVMAGYNTPNQYKFASGDVLVSSPDPDYFRLFTVSYIANVSTGQAPGVYVSSLQYIALASF